MGVNRHHDLFSSCQGLLTALTFQISLRVAWWLYQPILLGFWDTSCWDTQTFQCSGSWGGHEPDFCFQWKGCCLATKPNIWGLCEEQLPGKTKAKMLLCTSASLFSVVTSLPASLTRGGMPCQTFLFWLSSFYFSQKYSRCVKVLCKSIIITFFKK